MITEAEIDRLSRERAATRTRFQTLFDEVSGILFESDPKGINFETNTDEYEPEVGTILPRLHLATNTEDVALIVHEEFARWFGAEEAGNPGDYQLISEKIWQAWVAFGARAEICP